MAGPVDPRPVLLPAAPDLTDDEINDICRPLTQHAAQARFLRRLGVHVQRRLDGSLLVSRQHYIAVRFGAAVDTLDLLPSGGPGPKWKRRT